MANVFVSHAREDADEAAGLSRWLVDNGHHPFLDADPDHGIAPGDDWQRRLHERLRWADVVLCVITWPQVTNVPIGGDPTVQAYVTGVGSMLPAASTARTSNVWSSTDRLP